MINKIVMHIYKSLHYLDWPRVEDLVWGSLVQPHQEHSANHLSSIIGVGAHVPGMLHLLLDAVHL